MIACRAVPCRAVPCRRVDKLCSELYWVEDPIDTTPLRNGLFAAGAEHASKSNDDMLPGSR